MRLLVVALGLYLIFLPLWWYSLDAVSAVLAAFADPLYRLFDSNVSITSSGKLINVYVQGVGQGDSAGLNHTTALKVDTITYGIPLMIALVVTTRADSIVIKLRALAAGLLLMTAISVPAVMIWAKMTSLQLEEQIAIAGARGGRSAFLYYAFHGYAFSQPVVATATWLGMLVLGLFKQKLKEKREPHAPAPTRNAPCPCGSGLKYKRCCGRA